MHALHKTKNNETANMEIKRICRVQRKTTIVYSWDTGWPAIWCTFSQKYDISQQRGEEREGEGGVGRRRGKKRRGRRRGRRSRRRCRHILRGCMCSPEHIPQHPPPHHDHASCQVHIFSLLDAEVHFCILCVCVCALVCALVYVHVCVCAFLPGS